MDIDLGSAGPIRAEEKPSNPLIGCLAPAVLIVGLLCAIILMIGGTVWALMGMFGG